MLHPRKSAAIVLALALALTGCSSAPEWHPVTTEESQQLAIARFNNFDAGTRAFTTQLTADDGSELDIHGWYDFPVNAGYGIVTGEGFEPQELMWTPHEVAIRVAVTDGDTLPRDITAEGSSARHLEPSRSVLDSLLASFEAVNSDRPDNPLLLQQQGALWLERVKHGPSGEMADVFATPPSDDVLSPDDPAPTPEASTVNLWINETGLLLRLELRFATGWTAIDFADAGEDAPVLDGLPDLLFDLVQNGE